MAPAALLCSTGTVQSLCKSTASSSNCWQVKRSVPSGSALNRASAESKVEGGSLKSCLPASVYESRRRLGLRHIVRRGSSRHVFTSAVEGNVAVEEPSTESEVVESSDDHAPEASGVSEESSAAAAAALQRKGRSRRGNPRAKRDEPTVPVEALVPGAVFTGKVTTIQPFGAFVNFGAFTDGLVHISKLGSGYVSNVGDIVSLGQEVQVTVIDVDNTAGRIALSMVEKEEKEGSGRQGGAVDGERTRSQEGVGGRPVNKGKTAGRGNQGNRRDEPKKPQTKLVKGQVVEGTVKNSARGGVYVILPEEEEGFLKYSEIPGGENMAPEAGLQPGQKVNATVLRIDRGRIFLSMKPVVDLKNVNSTINEGADSGATNPFEIAFRAMDLIPEKEEVVEEAAETEAPVAETEESTRAGVADDEQDNSEEAETVSATEAVVEEVPSVEQEPTAAEIVEDTKPEEVAAEAAAPEIVEEKVDEVTQAPAAEVASPVEEKVEALAEAPEAAAVAPVEEKAEEVTEAPTVEAETPAPVEEKAEDVTEASAVESAIPAPVDEKAEEVTEAPTVDTATPVPVEEEVSEAPSAETATPAPVEEKAEEVTEAPAVEAAIPASVEEKAQEISEALSVEADTPTPVEEKAEEVTEVPVVEAAKPAPVVAPAAETKKGVSAAVVKQLRDETGAGMMDCKKALTDSNGDIEKAREFLRKKGLSSADKKASRIAAEGLIGSYIHDSRIGVLIEVNCETDFVSRGQTFKELVADLAMQVVASPQVQYVSFEDIPSEIVSKETDLEMQREDLASKPQAVRAKIVEGRVSKRMNELVLLEQPYIRNDSILVKDLIKQTISSLGENIKVRRFQRYNLGEGLEKRSEDFAAEVAKAAKVEERPAEAKPAAEGSLERKTASSS